MSVTVYNNTDGPINVCVSAAVNYDWRNRVLPGEYVVMDKFGVGTLNARWWFGDATEYAVSGVEIGFFVAGTVLAIVGLVLAIPSAGASLGLTAAGGAVLTMADAAAITGLYVAGFSAAVGGIAFAAKDFANTPATLTGVGVASNRIFSVEGKLKFSKLEKNILTVDPSPIELRELTPAKFQEIKARPKKLESEVEAVKSAYTISSALDRYDILNGNVWIYPSYSGIPALLPACWEPVAEASNAPLPVRLRSEKGPNAEWSLIPVNKFKAYNPKTADPKTNFDAYAYNIYNPALDLYASVSKDVNDSRILTKKHSTGQGSIRTPNEDPSTLFFIIQTANCYTFVPISRNSRGPDSIYLSAVVHQDGSLDNGTAVAVGQRTGEYPGRARWVVERINLEATNLEPRNGLSHKELEQLLGSKLADTRFRIVPAILEGNRLQNDYHPGWQLGSSDVNSFIVLGAGDRPSTEWEIRFKEAGEKGDLFTIYNNALKRYAVMGGGGFLAPGISEELFYFKYSMGFLSIRGRRNFSGMVHSYYALNLTGSSRIRQGGGQEAATPADKRGSLAKWAFVPTASK